MTPTGFKPVVTLIIDATFPGGQYLKVDHGSGVVEKINCPGFKLPENCDCPISAPTGDKQRAYELDDSYRVFVLGKELVDDAESNFSIIFASKKKLTTGTNSDVILHKAKGSSAHPMASPSDEYDTGGDGEKIPPHVGFEIEEPAKKARRLKRLLAEC
ncbi:MAG: hypothetical protein JST42_17385 [Bacteroidetes bacterium]|nr:hypothetical protein [Bacteroidota bacterium]